MRRSDCGPATGQAGRWRPAAIRSGRGHATAVCCPQAVCSETVGSQGSAVLTVGRWSPDTGCRSVAIGSVAGTDIGSQVSGASGCGSETAARDAFAWASVCRGASWGVARRWLASRSRASSGRNSSEKRSAAETAAGRPRFGEGVYSRPREKSGVFTAPGGGGGSAPASGDRHPAESGPPASDHAARHARRG